MGQSLAVVDEPAEPANGSFRHELSEREFAVTRQNGQLRHQETLVTADARYPLADFPAKYVIGSGHHSRSYLMEINGFLVESPITWYTSKQSWDVSPGYNHPLHGGFRREVPEKCLFCHAGRAVAVEQSLHRIQFLEHAIGCERCHGPGALHVSRQTGRAATKKEDSPEPIDHSIVNPAHLPRELADAVCHQCHLTTTAYVPARGRDIADFRPGLPLQDFRHYYQPRSATGTMRVVGHVDQLLQSSCYQKSESLSCMECHNPHAFPSSDERLEYYRTVCRRCHDEQACHVSPAELSERSPQNDCVKCHMPTTATDIPHMAFTHHRIGLHGSDSSTEEPPSEPGRSLLELEPIHDQTHLSEVDRARSLGLAYVDLLDRGVRGSGEAYLKIAHGLLQRFRDSGQSDGEVDATLARLAFEKDPNASLAYADNALRDPSLSAVSRVNSLYAMASIYLDQQRVERALGAMRQLARLRRSAADQALLGDCLMAIGDVPGAISAYEQATAIDANLVAIHELLAEHYERIGHQDWAVERRALAAAANRLIRSERNTAQRAEP